MNNQSKQPFILNESDRDQELKEKTNQLIKDLKGLRDFVSTKAGVKQVINNRFGKNK